MDFCFVRVPTILAVTKFAMAKIGTFIVIVAAATGIVWYWQSSPAPLEEKQQTSLLPPPIRPVRPPPAVSPLLPLPPPPPPPPVLSAASVRILVIHYIPFDQTGTLIDPNTPQTFPWARAQSEKSSADQIRALINVIEQGSRYHGYADPAAPPALDYQVMETIKRFAATPYRANRTHKNFLDYPAVFAGLDICGRVERENLSEIWLMIPPHHAGFAHPEFMLLGPHDPPYDDWELSDTPRCAKTYKVVTHNYDRWELMPEVWSHMLESEFRRIDPELWNLFYYPCYSEEGYSCYPLADASQPKIARCGNIHNPPNARSEYDRINKGSSQSDCKDWKPDGLGKLSAISCADWACSYGSSALDNHLTRYATWWMQNIPGWDNGKSYRGSLLRNWWDAHARYDEYVAGKWKLTETAR